MRLYRPQKYKIQPQIGDTKKVKKFVWWPKRIGDRIVFLEYCNKRFVFQPNRYADLYSYWDFRGFELIRT